MHILDNISLRPYNTFGIDAKAGHFCDINTLDELERALQLRDYPKKLVLSGGSNVLLTRDIQGLVLHINLKGIELVAEDEDNAIIKVMAGENWHQFVLWALTKNYGGLENLSLIPGNTGTAPIQNIGAYGVELKDIFISCEAMDREDQTLKTFTNAACQFGYRDSFFKNEGKDKYIITSVNFRLTKRNHNLNTSYGTIEEELKKEGIKHPSIKDISNAVVAIRKSKLPDPKELGNSGSFFKNPVITSKEFAIFMVDHPNAPFYRVSNDVYKIPAGWLIEQCGFKGKRYGDAGVHKNQALVLVNYGEASGKEILHLADDIIHSVHRKFGIQILPEVNIIK